MDKKAVMFSIQPQWVHKIIRNELSEYGKPKTKELRKRAPKLETPFTGYIYCTKGSKDWWDPWCTAYLTPLGKMENMSQKVIGEFTCNSIEWFSFPVHPDISERNKESIEGSCVTWEELMEYTRNEKGLFSKYDPVYSIDISDVVLFDEPIELKDFGLKRAPQSWCYVEDLNITRMTVCGDTDCEGCLYQHNKDIEICREENHLTNESELRANIVRKLVGKYLDEHSK